MERNDLRGMMKGNDDLIEVLGGNKDKYEEIKRKGREAISSGSNPEPKTPVSHLTVSDQISIKSLRGAIDAERELHEQKVLIKRYQAKIVKL